jgi:hypothetical protein
MAGSRTRSAPLRENNPLENAQHKLDDRQVYCRNAHQMKLSAAQDPRAYISLQHPSDRIPVGGRAQEADRWVCLACLYPGVSGAVAGKWEYRYR